MSNIYIQEPPTSGKVVIKTSVGDIDLELWTKEAPKASRNFIQLCMEGYYDNTIFHRVVKGFIIQGGDPTGTGEGGESIYGHPFKDEFHSRLRFCRRGLLAMANAGKDDNGSQFFFTLGATPELQNKHTIFGKVTGETVYNMLKLEEALVDKNERPLYPQKIIKTEVLNNPFQDIVPRVASKKSDADKEKKSEKKSGVKNFKLLSFGEEAEEDEEESVVLNKQFIAKGKSAHDTLSDPKLSSELAVEVSAGKEAEEDSDLDVGPSVPAWVKAKESKNNDWEDDSETQKSEKSAALVKEKEEMKERVKNKLKEKSTDGPNKKMKTVKGDQAQKNSIEDQKEEEEEEEYYLGKERHDERKRKAEEIRKEIRDLKRGVQKEKRAKELEEKEKVEKDEKKKQKTQVLEEFFESQKKYKDNIVVKKGASREQFTMQLLKKFGNKLQTAKEHVNESDEEEKETKGDKTSSVKTQIPKVPEKEDEEEDFNDESWMAHALHCEEKKPILAKDASTKDDDWFEIYDPRNPLNKRRRGENDQKRKDERGSSRRRR